jgi:hypothetical protein
MGRAHGMNGKEEKCTQDFGGKTRRRETTWKCGRAQIEGEHYDET